MDTRSGAFQRFASVLVI